MRTNIAGCRALFSRVISDAFSEAVSSYKPRPTATSVLEKREKRRKKIRKIFLFTAKNYQYAEENQLKLSFLLIDLLTIIYRIIDIYPNDNDEKAYYAREFLTDQNSRFCWYCAQLGVDPEYASEKLQREIARSDFYGKIFYINCVKLLMSKKYLSHMKYLLKIIN